METVANRTNIFSDPDGYEITSIDVAPARGTAYVHQGQVVLDLFQEFSTTTLSIEYTRDNGGPETGITQDIIVHDAFDWNGSENLGEHYRLEWDPTDYMVEYEPAEIRGIFMFQRQVKMLTRFTLMKLPTVIQAGYQVRRKLMGRGSEII